VGECGRNFGPGRREIGHGKLAWRALQAVLPAPTDFPYTIRVVSEITESNGSSSMASVCGGSLSMMDAGVPLRAPVAGVAMGLILQDDGKYAVLTDILGDEDHLGDMDCKGTGTVTGVTALQMDIKIQGITEEIMEAALQQAMEARMHILGEMNKVLDKSRDKVSDNAPAMQVAHRSHVISMLDGAALRAVIEQEKPDYIVPEIEAIATDTLVALEREGFNVVPTARATQLTMNREGIRRLAAEELGLKTSPYQFAASKEEYLAAIEQVGLPCVVKPIMSSSGKGQSTVKKPGRHR
jgi:hypothetical protein